MSSRSRSIRAVAMSAMVVLAGPAAAASSGRALLSETPDAPPPPTPGQVLIPGMQDDYGNLITAMLANQGGMIGEMASILHPALADPLASLANMMTIVQTSIPDLLAGAGLPFEPNPLVHEMFVKYSNGTKTDADLALIDKGLDELFSHDFTEDDKEKLVDFMDLKDAFANKGSPLPGKDINYPTKTPKEWPAFNPKNLVNLDVKTYKPEFPEKPHDELDDKFDELDAKQKAHFKYIKDKEDKWQAELDAKAAGKPKDIKVLKSNLTTIAKNFGDAYKKKVNQNVVYKSSDAKIVGQANVWNAIYNKTNLGSIKNGTLPNPKWYPLNIGKKNQSTLLQADELKYNLTKLAFPTNKGKDPLRPIIDVITSDPVGDAIAPVTPFLTFRDPVLKGVARSRTSVSTKVSADGTTPAAVKVYDRDGLKNKIKPWTSAKGGYKSTASNNLLNGFQQSKVDLFNFGFSKFQYRPCIFSEGYTALSVGAELLRIRPEGLNLGFDGARVSPQLIDVSPVLVKVQAVGAQINPEYINVEPILVSVSPKVNMAGKAVAKPWQLTKPPKFGPKPKEDFKTLPPYPKPHT